MILSIAIISAIVAIYFYWQSLKTTSRTPRGCKKIPEEPGLPIIGVLNKAESPLCNYLTKLGKKHGPIYQIKFGMRNMVVLNSFKYIKEALITNGDTFLGRWKLMTHIMASDNVGIVFIDGHVWSEHRSFIVKTLRDFGIGRLRSVEIIQNECLFLLEDLEKLNKKEVNFSSFISTYTANVICKFLMNKRYGPDDAELKIINNIMIRVAKDKDPVSVFSLMFPFLDDHDWIMKFIIWVTSRKSLFDESHELFAGIIQEHLNQLDLNGEGEDLIDRFLMKQHQIKESYGHVDIFKNIQLVRNIVELLMAGYDTTSTALVWSCMFMSMYPEIQKKVHEELDENIGNERLPTMNDKKHLNYIQAVMDEVLRLSSIVPLAVFHRALKDCCIDGHFLPKDTLIITNLFASHIDPNIWEKPFEFYPHHFLRKDDNSELKYNPREELIVFGMGKRQCLGESLARMEYFIFFTSILQRFHVRFPDDISNSATFDVFRATDGLVRTTELRNFIFTRRH